MVGRRSSHIRRGSRCSSIKRSCSSSVHCWSSVGCSTSSNCSSIWWSGRILYPVSYQRLSIEIYIKGFEILTIRLYLRQPLKQHRTTNWISFWGITFHPKNSKLNFGKLFSSESLYTNEMSFKKRYRKCFCVY